METWRNELYHSGRKGMKWGKHIFGKESPAAGTRQGSGNAPNTGRFKSRKRNVTGNGSGIKRRDDLNTYWKKTYGHPLLLSEWNQFRKTTGLGNRLDQGASFLEFDKQKKAQQQALFNDRVGKYKDDYMKRIELRGEAGSTYRKTQKAMNKALSSPFSNSKMPRASYKTNTKKSVKGALAPPDGDDWYKGKDGAYHPKDTEPEGALGEGLSYLDYDVPIPHNTNPQTDDYYKGEDGAYHPKDTELDTDSKSGKALDFVRKAEQTVKKIKGSKAVQNGIAWVTKKFKR